jgi:hypothetical protein
MLPRARSWICWVAWLEQLPSFLELFLLGPDQLQGTTQRIERPAIGTGEPALELADRVDAQGWLDQSSELLLAQAPAYSISPEQRAEIPTWRADWHLTPFEPPDSGGAPQHSTTRRVAPIKILAEILGSAHQDGWLDTRNHS